MAIQRRLKAEPEAAKAWKAVQAKTFNADPKLMKYHAEFWDVHYPKLLKEIEHFDPKLAERISQDISWDRKMAGIIMFLRREDHPVSEIKATPKTIGSIRLKLKRASENSNG